MTPSRRHFQPHSLSGQHPLGHILFHPIVLLIWVVLCALLSWQLWHSMGNVTQSIERQKGLEQKVKQDEKEGAALLEKLDKADTPFAQEKVIRDQLNMQKPGEIILQLPTPSPESP